MDFYWVDQYSKISIRSQPPLPPTQFVLFFRIYSVFCKLFIFISLIILHTNIIIAFQHPRHSPYCNTSSSATTKNRRKKARFVSWFIIIVPYCEYFIHSISSIVILFIFFNKAREIKIGWHRGIILYTIWENCYIVSKCFAKPFFEIKKKCE